MWPYVSKVSEKVAKPFKEYGIKTVHKPSSTIKNILFNYKDRIHDLDKSGLVYEINCKKHEEEYVGETDGPMKERGYEHKIVTHKDSKISHSLGKKKIENKSRNENQGKRSERLSKQERLDYKTLNVGKRLIINTGGSEVAEHMQHENHEDTDIEYKIIGTESNWYKRGIREAIEIRRRKPSLNQDEGRYNLSQIWNKSIETKVTSNQGSGNQYSVSDVTNHAVQKVASHEVTSTTTTTEADDGERRESEIHPSQEH